MVTLDQTLQTHLPTVAYQAIQAQFGEDPADLFRDEGVNYEYEDKVWNIRIGSLQNESEEVTDVFVRTHSATGIYGNHFSARSNKRIYQREIEVGRDSSSGSSRPKGNPKNLQYSFEFMEILSSGVRNNDAEIPQVPKPLLEKLLHNITIFFESCPELIPPHFDPPPQNDNNPLSQCITATAIISGLATLYLGYKTIQNTYHYLKGESNSIWPIASKIVPLAITSLMFYTTAPRPWQQNQ